MTGSLVMPLEHLNQQFHFQATFRIQGDGRPVPFEHWVQCGCCGAEHRGTEPLVRLWVYRHECGEKR